MLVIEKRICNGIKRNDTSGCSHGPPVLDITEQYYGNQLPIVGAERAGVDQEPSFVDAVVVRERCHCSTSAKPWHGLFPLASNSRLREALSA